MESLNHILEGVLGTRQEITRNIEIEEILKSFVQYSSPRSEPILIDKWKQHGSQLDIYIDDRNIFVYWDTDLLPVDPTQFGIKKIVIHAHTSSLRIYGRKMQFQSPLEIESWDVGVGYPGREDLANSVHIKNLILTGRQVVLNVPIIKKSDLQINAEYLRVNSKALVSMLSAPVITGLHLKTGKVYFSLQSEDYSLFHYPPQGAQKYVKSKVLDKDNNYIPIDNDYQEIKEGILGAFKISGLLNPRVNKEIKQIHIDDCTVIGMLIHIVPTHIHPSKPYWDRALDNICIFLNRNDFA